MSLRGTSRCIAATSSPPEAGLLGVSDSPPSAASSGSKPSDSLGRMETMLAQAMLADVSP